MAIKLFSNVLAYRLTDPADFHSNDISQLNQMLSEHRSRKPAATELSHTGFIEPVGEEDRFIEPTKGLAFVFAVRTSTRMLPGKIVREEVATEVREIEQEEKRKVYAREKQQIKDKVITRLLPQAFIDRKTVYVMVNGPYVLIDSSSAKRGEEILSLLRSAIGRLGVRPVAVKTTPIDAYTRWFTTNETDCDFVMTGDFKAQNRNDESDLLNGKGTSPESEGLSDLVHEHDRRVTQLGLLWPSSTGESVSFTVNEMIGIKGIKWPESLADQAANDAGDEEDKHAMLVNLLRATFLLLTAELHEMLTQLLTALGGEELPGDEEDHDLLSTKLARMAQLAEQYQRDHGATFVPREPRQRQQPEDDEFDTDDPLYDDAVAFVRESHRASISAVQRKLKIGYNRAARLIERMEEEGVVTELSSNGSREVIRASTKVNEAAEMDDLV